MKACIYWVIFSLPLTILGCGYRYGAISGDHALFVIPEGVETRWASQENPTAARGAGGQANAGRKGAACFALPAGASHVLAREDGTSGTIRRIWITISDRSPAMLRGIRLDFYWDGAETPAISVPIGDFFCHGLGKMARFENALFSSPEARSFNCIVPMPFRTGMRIVAINETGTDLPMFFYEVDYTIGDRHGRDTLYFHAHFRRENPTTLQEDFEILPLVTGRGRYLGANLSVIANLEEYHRTWWGEGEVKIYLDGDTEFPTLCGTGTEDYIGTGWGQGRYDEMFQGCHQADSEIMRYGFYRLHVPDPVYFHRDIRVTIQQIGYAGAGSRAPLRELGTEIFRAGPGLRPIDLSGEGGLPLFERRDDWAVCTWFYLDRPENGLPPLAPFSERVAGL